MPAARPRCRFAPSPTGYLHVGSAHSSLCNWLFARSTGGEFLLRIEDTDVERNRPELTDNILDMLRWLGIDWDGEPVHQSERFEAYRAAAATLHERGRAYYCECTTEQVLARNRDAAEPGRHSKPGYDGFCRDRGLEAGEGRALRFLAPDAGTTSWDDIIRGTVEFDNANIEDFVLLRSNGTPTFLLANVVDDDFMAITHVIRGEDHVNGTPKYLLIRAALGLEGMPRFAHLPLLVNDKRQKLSKRRDDVSVADYKERGYLPEAMRNYLALLGWGPPDGVEVRPIEEIVSLFRLEEVNPSPAFFDLKKLDHVNGEWIRRLDVEDFVARAAGFLPPGDAPLAALRAIAPLVQERLKTLAEVDQYVDFLYLGDIDIDEAAWAKAVKDDRAILMLDATIERLIAIEDWRPAAIEAAVTDAAMTAGYVNPEGKAQLSKAQAPVRIATTGRPVGPPLWESLGALGQERTLTRLHSGRARLA